MDFNFLPSFPPTKRMSALTLSSPTSYSPVTPVPEPAPAPMSHLSASRVLFDEGLYSDLVMTLQVPGSVKKTIGLHSRILAKESEFFSALLAGKRNVSDKAITLLDEPDSKGAKVIEVTCVDAAELYAFESTLRLLYTGSWCSERDYQTNSLDARLRRGLDVMNQAGRLALRNTTTALLQQEIFDMCRQQPELLEKVSKALRPDDAEDDQAILKFDLDALQAMCRVAVVKDEIRDHCELVIARNLYGPKKFRDLRMNEVQMSELRAGYIFPPGGQESIYLLKGALSLPLHPCRETNVEALRHVVDHYTAYNSQQPLRVREFYVPEQDDDVPVAKTAANGGDAQEVTFYRVAFTTGFQWLLDQVIKVQAPFALIILLLRDAVEENADRRTNVTFGEFATSTDGDIYLRGVSYIADGLLRAFQDPSLEHIRNPGASGSLLNMISYGITSLTDLPPLRPRPASGPGSAARHHLDYPALSTMVMEFFWQVLELALKRPHHSEFVKLLLDSITRVAPLAPFEVLDRIEERLAELLEETRKKIMEERGNQTDKEDGDHDDDDDDESVDLSEDDTPIQVTGDKRVSARYSDHGGEYMDDDRKSSLSMISSVLLASEPAPTNRLSPLKDSQQLDSDSFQDQEPETEPEAADEPELETPWMRPEYLQPLCLQLLTTFPMNIQSSLLWAIHDLQLL